MVRIAQVNMYLHQFKNPQIFQYDALTNEERWSDKYDVILANPPFMSPKGGIKPHNKFGVASNRAEVLFVDYIMNHLRPKGRAGIIVPEGIIFQRGIAYKELRKNLLENGLYAVVSLPGGVFQPYSGVKTSILLFDNELAKQKTEVVFLKISADGFDLGASKRVVSQNDLPAALDFLRGWAAGAVTESPIASTVSKEDIAISGDYNLSGERYKAATEFLGSHWPVELLSTLEDSGALKLGRGQIISKTDLIESPGIYPVYSSSAQGIGEFGQYGKYLFDEEMITWSVDGGGRFFYRPQHKFSVTNVSGWLRILEKEKIDAKYLFYVLDNQWKTKEFDYVSKAHPSVIREMYKIPLPPLEVQKQIVTELDGYAAIISGAKQIVENWKPKITVESDWPQFTLGDIATFEYGLGNPASDSGMYRFVRITDINNAGLLKTTDPKYVDLEDSEMKYVLNKGDVLVARTGATYGKCLYFDSDVPSVFAGYLIRIAFNESLMPRYFWMYSQSLEFEKQKQKLVTGGGQPQFNANALGKVELAIPPLETQAVLIAKMESEKRSVESAQDLIETFEARMSSVISDLWDY
jgi:type I restriction enzyme M protein